MSPLLTVSDQNDRSVQTSLGRLWGLLFSLLNSDTLKLFIDGFHLLRSVIQERSTGLYEVLDFEHTLELCDAEGEKATYHKRATVRLLQDHVASYLDQAWGKGEIFAEYHCSPGVPVDRYRYGHKHCVLISLREIKRRGDVIRIRIDRTVRNGFTVETGWSETSIQHQTHHCRVAVIFPAKRPPRQVSLLEVNRNVQTTLGEPNTERLPDGRQKVFWETTKPNLFETYTLKWTW